MLYFICFIYSYCRVSVTQSSLTARFAEEKDRDYEAEIAKMEKEAMERLDAKTEEMKGKIATTGATSK